MRGAFHLLRVGASSKRLPRQPFPIYPATVTIDLLYLARLG
jgi:hypothetical protein